MRTEEGASFHREDGKSAKNERKKMGISAAMLVAWPEHGWHELLREGDKMLPFHCLAIRLCTASESAAQWQECRLMADSSASNR